MTGVQTCALPIYLADTVATQLHYGARPTNVVAGVTTALTNSTTEVTHLRSVVRNQLCCKYLHECPLLAVTTGVPYSPSCARATLVAGARVVQVPRRAAPAPPPRVPTSPKCYCLPSLDFSTFEILLDEIFSCLTVTP